jgi:hypothetical protein
MFCQMAPTRDARNEFSWHDLHAPPPRRKRSRAATSTSASGPYAADGDGALSYLERTYNDGRRYVLHDVTAREAYNLARAAAEGASGGQRQYLDTYAGRYQASVCLRPPRSSTVTPG